MAQNHIEQNEAPMTRGGTIQGPSRRYRRLRHPTFPADEWADKNPLLQRGELGIESDTHQIKAGDGYTLWNDLPYATGGGGGGGDVEFQKPTAANGYKWYRKYPDGWVEQGQLVVLATAGTTNITLPIQMDSAIYSIQVSAAGAAATPTYTGATATGFSITSSVQQYVCWEAKGLYA